MVPHPRRLPHSIFCALAVAVDLDDGGVDHGVFEVGVVLTGPEKPSENIGFHPVTVSLEYRVPLAEAGWQITPWGAGSDDPENRLNEQPVVGPAASGVGRLPQTMRLHFRPLGVGQHESLHPERESRLS